MIEAVRSDNPGRSVVAVPRPAADAPGGQTARTIESIPVAVSIETGSESLYFRSQEELESSFRITEKALISEDNTLITISRRKEIRYSKDVAVMIPSTANATIFETYRKAMNPEAGRFCQVDTWA